MSGAGTLLDQYHGCIRGYIPSHFHDAPGNPICSGLR